VTNWRGSRWFSVYLRSHVEVKAGRMLDFDQMEGLVNTGSPLLYYFGRTPTSVAQQALAGFTPPYSLVANSMVLLTRCTNSHR